MMHSCKCQIILLMNNVNEGTWHKSEKESVRMVKNHI